MINLCPSIWFTNTQILHFLKGCYFVMGGSVDMNDDVFWLFKKCSLQLFPKYSQSYTNLNVKVGQNSTQQLLKNIQVVLVFFI